MGTVSEHEAPLATRNEAAPITNPEQMSVVRMVHQLLERSKKASQEFRSQWPRNYQFVFSGRQWPIERPEWRFSEVVNLVWADIMTEVGIQTDARPKVDYVPTEPSDIPFAQILKEINDINWQKYPWHQQIADCILDSKWCHVSHLEVTWNPELEGGLGDVEHKILNPYGCYWDPSACDVDACRFFIYVEPVSTEKLRKSYPKFKEEIVADIESGAASGSFDRVSVSSDKVDFSLGRLKSGRPNPDNQRYGGEPMTLVVRCWIKDDSVEELIDEKQTDGWEVKKEYILKKKYPKGRYIEVANNVVLKDQENGVEVNGKVVPWEHGKFPIIRFVNYSYPREYAGETEVTHRIGPQIVTNYIWSFILDTMKQQANPKEVFSAANVDAADKSSNEPGQILVLPDFAGYRREPGQGIPPNLEGILDYSLKLHDKVGGLQDVIRGNVDPSIGSSLLFSGYIEAAQVRPRLKNRNLDESLKRIGYLDACMYLQFYTAPRSYRLTNKEGWPEFVSFYVSDEGGQLKANVTRTTPNANGVYVQGQTEAVPVKGIPDVQVVTGSSIPFQKAQQYNRAKELFGMGAIDQTALLNEIEFPGREEILSRMQQQAAQAAQMQPPPK